MRHHFLIDQRIFENINESAKKADLSTETVLTYAFYEVINSWTDWSDKQPMVTCFTGKRSFTVQRRSTHVTALDTCGTFEQLIAEANKSSIDGQEEKPKFVLNYESKDRQQAVIENALLTCSMTQQGDDLEVVWDINASFKHYKSDRELVAAHQKLLTWLATGFLKQRPPSLLPSEQQKVREEVNSVSKAFPDHLLHKGFFEKASETPDQIALIWSSDEGIRQVTYQELAQHALSLASVLVEEGVKPDDFVAVTLPKGMNQITAVLGVLAAGAVYVPIAPDLPEDRKVIIRKKANINVVVTDQEFLSRDKDLSDGTKAVLVEAVDHKNPMSSPLAVSSSSLAYVIFTSGSTGTPKGVEITHHAAFNTIFDINTRYNVSNQDRILALSALDFDLSVYDIFGLLSVGGTLVIPDDKDRKEASVWVKLVQQYQVTVWNTVPALLDMILLATEGIDRLSSLRTVLVSGDWVGLDLSGRLKKQAPNATFVALGGATEAAIWSNYYEVGEIPNHWKSIPYGKPLSNQKYRICDPSGRDCPDSVVGELWIGGKGLSNGYLKEPELTANSFITDQGERWYKTGDLGKYWTDGNIEFLGRKDQQVKVRGFRIELGEIESTLKKIEGVGGALAAVHDTGTSRHLVAGVAEKIVQGALASHERTQTACDNEDDKLLAAGHEAQIKLVEHFLATLLGFNRLNSSEETEIPIASLGVIRAQEPLLNLWMKWLQTRKVIFFDGKSFKKGERLMEVLENSTNNGPIQDKESHLVPIKERLTERMEAFKGILYGDVSPTFLLEDDMLSPEALSENDFGTCEGISRMATRINALAKERDELSIGILGGGTGILASRLLKAVEGSSISFTIMETSSLLLKTAADRLSDSPYVIKYERVLEEVPLNCQYAFDVVIAINVFHRYKIAHEGPLFAKLMLKSQGALLALEPDSVSPLSHITAAVLEEAFYEYDNERNIQGSPMLDQNTWKSFFIKAGFDQVCSTLIDGTSTHLFEAKCPENRVEVDLNDISKFLASQLPEHMVPEQLKIIPFIPLSANGKIDRKAFVKSFEIPEQIATSDLPREGSEMTIANIWKDLLEIETVGRNQAFFEIGGDSLSATRFLAVVKKELGIELSLRELLDAPLEALATSVEAKISQKEKELELMEEGEI